MPRPKYIEANEVIYEVDDWFVEQIKRYPSMLALCIAKQIDQQAKHLPKLNSWSQKAGGVCHEGKEPVFFEVEFVNEIGDVPIFLDINVIDSDDYLDYMLDNQILKSNETKNTEPRSGVTTESDTRIPRGRHNNEE